MWQVVTGLTDLNPGEMKAVSVAGKPVAVAKVGENFLAFADECTHMHCALSTGFLAGTVVECPCHGGKFDISDGRALALPATAPVQIYPTKVENGQLLIEI